MDERLAERMCSAELTQSRAYRVLASLEDDEERRRLLEKLAEEEQRHYEFWRRKLGRECRARSLPLWLVRLSYRLLGPRFTLSLLERLEESSIEAYKRLLGSELDEELRRILEEEEKHERELAEAIRDARLEYLGFVALGLSDAIVELVGVYAGFTGAAWSPRIVALAGLIVGVSAAVSMAAAAFVQARQEGRNPLMSALATGLAYMATVFILALPFLLLNSTLAAFATALAEAALLSTLLAAYTAIVRGESVAREAVLTTSVMLSAAVAGYLLGGLLSKALGVELPSG